MTQARSEGNTMTGSLDSLPRRIPRDVARHLGYYVYLYVDPRTDAPFYVGKGLGQRALAHLSPEQEDQKAQILRELRSANQEPRIDILAHGLPDEQTALRIEAAVIDLFNLDRLTNRVRGWKSIKLGRWPLRELIIHYAAKPVTIDDPVMLIRITKQFTPDMPANELYKATRRAWKVGARRTKAAFACAVFEGVVREVYRIRYWRKASFTLGRQEFVGEVADQSIRSKYLVRRVEAYLRQGAQNPITYVNC